MISFYGERIYKCISCGAEDIYPFNKGLCGNCTYKELTSHVNSLCQTCKNRCNQTSLVTIARCPEYNPKTSSDAQKGALEPRSSKKRVPTKKKAKKALKPIKRKKK